MASGNQRFIKIHWQQSSGVAAQAAVWLSSLDAELAAEPQSGLIFQPETRLIVLFAGKACA
jgi:hypothetical protein